jgi:hypothetical protein
LELLSVLVLDIIEILPPLGKYKYDTGIILSVKCYIDNSVRMWSCIRNVNTCDTAPTTTTPQAPDEAPHAPGTYNANAATGRRRTIDAVKCGSATNTMFPSKPGFQNNRSRNGTPWELIPCAYCEDAGRKDQGWALLDGGSSPPLFDEDGHVIMDAAALTNRRGKGAYKESNSQVIHMSAR